MRTALIILAVAVGLCGGAWAYSYIYFAEIDASADWEIRIYGAPDGFYVWYIGHERVEPSLPPDAIIEQPLYGFYVAGEFCIPGIESYVFKVDSLTEIKPTPAEMEAP
jgi:hypothetical protein